MAVIINNQFLDDIERLQSVIPDTVLSVETILPFGKSAKSTYPTYALYWSTLDNRVEIPNSRTTCYRCLLDALFDLWVMCGDLPIAEEHVEYMTGAQYEDFKVIRRPSVHYFSCATFCE